MPPLRGGSLGASGADPESSHDAVVAAMLSVIKLADAEYTIGQVALGIEDYYLGIGEAPGVWAGRWAPALGLEGVVEAGDLRALVNGVDPADQTWWFEGRPARKVNAFDATFSAPKSASVLWAFGSAEIASVVSRAHVQAVAEALEFLEDRAAVSRQQTGGVRTRVGTDGWAIATFVHRTSRAGDPQLHTHCIVPNVVRRADGSHASADGAVLYTWAKAAGSVYQEQLRRILSAELGVTWGADRNGCREMIGFSAAQLRAFSKRTSAIDAYLERSDGVYVTAVERMRADHLASLATRPAKDRELTPARLRDRWAAEAAAAGLGDPHAVETAVTGSDVAGPDLGGRVGARSPLAFDEMVAALTDPDSGLCANDSRFGEAHVVERVAALGAGRLTVAQIGDLAAEFLASDHVVRLSVEPADAVVRSPPRWTTTAHLDLEWRVIDRLEELIDRRLDGLDPGAVARAIAAETPGLGADQAAAVRVLCGPGPALRSLIAPAGFGKTTAVHAAAVAATGCGRPVIGVATTNRAVAELRDVGVPAMTIARLAMDLTDRRLDPGTVIILDEASQTATADAEVVLAAALEAPGAQLWCLGDVRQAQAVRAGGLAAELDRLGADGHIPAATLQANRRQSHPAERLALAAYRTGDVTGSQMFRTDAGLEHEHQTPQETREAMADAAAADVIADGGPGVVALAVSHADCEDLADRIRTRLIAAGMIGGPALEGPGWAAEPRAYQAGDRILLHARFAAGAVRLHNGTTLTVNAVTPTGLTAISDGGGTHVLPVAFLSDRRRDGRPNVSHAWCRTVDGAQGGTWDRVHLLGSAALDHFSGYVGQSRARTATHTWNVAQLPAGDWGGRLADRRSGTEMAADAMRRAPLKTFAAHDDPFARDRQLRTEIAAHQAVLAAGPPDVAAQLDAARQQLTTAETHATEVAERLRFARAQAELIGPLAAIRREPRDRRERWLNAAAVHQAALVEAQNHVARWQAEVARLQPMHDARAVWHHDQGWQVQRVTDATAELDAHWARTVLGATDQDEPLAFGADRLRRARRHFATAVRDLEASLPIDRTDALARAEADLAHHQVNYTHAIDVQARAERRLETASTRRLGMRDKPAIAAAQIDLGRARGDAGRSAELVAAAEAIVAVERQAVVARIEAEEQSAPERAAAAQAAVTLADALVATRTGRVAAAAADPSGAHLGEHLGAPPHDQRGQQAWCGLAYRIETALDEPREPARLGWSTDYLDHVVRGVLANDPASINTARQIIARAASGPEPRGPNTATDRIRWEQAVHLDAQPDRAAHTNTDHGIGM